MLGLVLNNYYLVKSNLNMNFIMGLSLLILFVLTQNDMILFLLTFFITLVLPTTSFNAERESRVSGWFLIENEMPVRKGTIILSRYLLFFIISFFSLLFITGIVLMIGPDKMAIDLSVPGFRKMTMYELTYLYLVLTQLMGIVYYPLMYLLNNTKNDVVLIITIILAMLIFSILDGCSKQQVGIAIILLYICSFVGSYIIKYKLRYKIGC